MRSVMRTATRAQRSHDDAAVLPLAASLRLAVARLARRLRQQAEAGSPPPGSGSLEEDGVPGQTIGSARSPGSGHAGAGGDPARTADGGRLVSPRAVASRTFSSLRVRN